MTTTLSLQDRLDLHELAARYGQVIDDRDWDDLRDVFTDDATFETRGFGERDSRTEGLAAIRAMLTASRHPVAHHVTNVVPSIDGDRVTLRFKVLGPGPGGRVGSADYHDVVRREPAGWRIATHVAILRQVVAPPTS